MKFVLIIILVVLIILCYYTVNKDEKMLLENCIFENVALIQIFTEYSIFFIFFIATILVVSYYFIKLRKLIIITIIFSSLFFFNNNNNGGKEEKLTEWEIEFQKEKEKEEELDELERIREKKAFKKNRSERRKRRKIRYETVEYPGEKYHPDYDGVYFFYERFQDAIWRTENTRYFRAKFKIYFPFVILFIFTVFAWLIAYLSNLDFFIYDIKHVYVKIDNQFIHLNRKVFSKKWNNFITVIDWNDLSVNRYKILKNGKFIKYKGFFITNLKYNWMFQKDIRSKKFPFNFYNWVFHKDDIMICGEKQIKYRRMFRRITKHYSFYKPWTWFNSKKPSINKYIKHNFNIRDGRPQIYMKVIDKNRKR